MIPLAGKIALKTCTQAKYNSFTTFQNRSHFGLFPDGVGGLLSDPEYESFRTSPPKDSPQTFRPIQSQNSTGNKNSMKFFAPASWSPGYSLATQNYFKSSLRFAFLNSPCPPDRLKVFISFFCLLCSLSTWLQNKEMIVTKTLPYTDRVNSKSTGSRPLLS